MLITKHTEIVIKNSPDAIWEFSSNPKHWSASNPKEHFGLKIDSKSGRPETGATFHQRESVAGIFADLRGHFLYVDKPYIVVWTGIAAYKILRGFIRVRIPEGGVAKLIKTQGGSVMSHDVFMDFPNTLLGKIEHWYFTHVLHGEKAVYDHTYRELEYFKKQLDRESF